jgi:hypothetical protein
MIRTHAAAGLEKLNPQQRRAVEHGGSRLAHVPEKACPGLDPGWKPVFRKGHAISK